MSGMHLTYHNKRLIIYLLRNPGNNSTCPFLVVVAEVLTHILVRFIDEELRFATRTNEQQE